MEDPLPSIRGNFQPGQATHSATNKRSERRCNRTGITMGKEQKVSKRRLLENEELTHEVFGGDVFKKPAKVKELSNESISNRGSRYSSSADFQIDRTGDYSYHSGEITEGLTGSTGGDDGDRQIPKNGSDSTYSSAAWHDDDDDRVEIDLNSTDRLKKLKKSVNDVISGTELSQTLKERFETQDLSWSKDYENVNDDSSDDEYHDKEIENLLTDAKSLVRGSLNGDGIVTEGKLDIRRMVDANITDPSPSNERVTVTKFHPNGDCLMVGSTDKYLRFFKVDGENNEKQHGILFNDMIVSSANFVGKSLNQVVVAGRKPYFYSYDMRSGRSMKVPGLHGKGLKSHELMAVSPKGTKIAFAGVGGYIHIVCGIQKTIMFDIKMNTAVRCMTFTDEEHLLTSGLDADVYIWDLRYQGRCLGKFAHDDGTCSSSLSYHPSGYMAIGAESGVVSLYETANSFVSGLTNEEPVKIRSVMNLTMKINALTFHHSGQLLAMASDQARDELRLVHTQTATVFSNWPTDRSPIRRAQSLDFSPKGGYFAVGNNKGKVLLYRLNAFPLA